MKESTHNNIDNFLQNVFQLLGLTLTPSQVNAFLCYEKELIEWNSRFNLTAIREVDAIRTKHFLDSLSCMLVLRDNPSHRMVDIGTGAGFPGLPIKIVMPELKLTLVESVGKKADFCRHITSQLGLEGVEIIHGRAEDIGQMPEYREKYDWAVARAVASLPVLAEYMLPLVRLNGAALAQKGENTPEESQGIDHALNLLGGQMRPLQKINLPGIAADRYLVVIDKTRITPKQFPRRAGIPAKKPLK